MRFPEKPTTELRQQKGSALSESGENPPGSPRWIKFQAPSYKKGRDRLQRTQRVAPGEKVKHSPVERTRWLCTSYAILDSLRFLICRRGLIVELA